MLFRQLAIGAINRLLSDFPLEVGAGSARGRDIDAVVFSKMVDAKTQRRQASQPTQSPQYLYAWPGVSLSETL